MKNEAKELITKLHLARLGVQSEDELNEWNKKDFQIDTIEKITEIVNGFLNKTIYIFGDYDVDGTMATTILYMTLKRLGAQNVKFRIPHRFTEGFGLNKTMIDEIEEKPKDTLIISVDNGIAAIGEVTYAKDKGFTVVITDHHQPVIDQNGKIQLPRADAIMDPNAIHSSADFNGYCGAGLAYKLAKSLLSEKNIRTVNPGIDEERVLAIGGFIYKLTPLVALATVCDQVDLKEENFVLVKQGLEMLNEGEALPGLLILGEILGVSHWTADTFGFKIGPCINAPERMKDGAASIGMMAMMYKDREKTETLANLLVKYNDQRKAAVEYGYKKANEIIERRGEPGYPIVEYIPRLDDEQLTQLQGYLGNIVGRVTEDKGVPVGLFTDGEDGILKGSFRSVEGFDIKEHLDKIQSHLVQHGGHAMAAGVSVTKENFEEMRAALQSISVPVETKQKEIVYDAVIEDQDIAEAIELDNQFAPFGQGNEPLVYKIENFKLVPDKGEIKKKLKGNGVRFRSVYSTAVGFGLFDLAEKINGPCTLTIYGRISNNYFNGRVNPQIEIIDFEVQNTVKSKATQLQELLANTAKNRF